MVPSAIQQSRGPQCATGIVITNTALPSVPLHDPQYPDPHLASHGAHGGPFAAPPGTQHAQPGEPGRAVPWWYSDSVPENAAVPAHAAPAEPDFGALQLPSVLYS